MTEDETYRASTQYRLWSFTPPALASLRSTTNALASEGVKAAIQSKRAEAEGQNNGELTELAEKAPVVECLTVEEEQRLVGFYCLKTMEFASFCEFPTNVMATAVQYLKRFYLSNSPMTYHPKEMMPISVFFATKTENNYISLRRFAEKLPKTTAEQIIAPEFLLTQGLRFTFDVRHPQRGLEGGFMELLALANGKGQPAPGIKRSSAELQNEMIKLPPAGAGKARTKTSSELVSRIGNIHDKAKEVLKTSALLSDAYFLYTPSQIWLSTLLLVDEPLASFYLDTKVPATSPMRSKLMVTLKSCVETLKSSPSADPGKEERSVCLRIDKKLYKCRNPDKLDLVSISKAQKRDGEGKEGELDDKIVKKRKLERENSLREGEDVFGPPLSKAAKQ